MYTFSLYRPTRFSLASLYFLCFFAVPVCQLFSKFFVTMTCCALFVTGWSIYRDFFLFRLRAPVIVDYTPETLHTAVLLANRPEASPTFVSLASFHLIRRFVCGPRRSNDIIFEDETISTFPRVIDTAMHPILRFSTILSNPVRNIQFCAANPPTVAASIGSGNFGQPLTRRN